MAKKKTEEEKVEVVEVEAKEEQEETVVEPVKEEKTESLFKKVLGEIKAFLIIIIIIGVVGGGTWYWYTHIYDGDNTPKKNASNTTKDGRIYSYSSDANHNDLTVLGNYLIERESNYVTKIMNLKTEVLYDENIECNYFSLGVDNNLYLVSDESGENENTITLYKFDGEKLEELESIVKLGVYYAPIYYQKDDVNYLMGFTGHYFTQDEDGNEVSTDYINLINGKTYELNNESLFGNTARLAVSEEVYTQNDRYIVTFRRTDDDYIYGVYDLKEGKDIIEPIYEVLKEIGNNRYVAQKNGKAGIIDINRKILVDYKYDFIDVNDGFFVVGKNNKLAIMNDKYNMVTDFLFDVQSGIEDKKFEYLYYPCCSNSNTFVAYKVGNKYVLVNNYRDYGYYNYDKHETYLISENGSYETVEERSFGVKDKLIYAEKDKNIFVIYNEDLTVKYELDLTRYDYDVYDLDLINGNTLVANSDNNAVYVDYETGEIVDKVLEYSSEYEGIKISYKNNKLTVKVDDNEKTFELTNFERTQVKVVDEGFYYINESSNKSIYLFVEKGE